MPRPLFPSARGAACPRRASLVAIAAAFLLTAGSAGAQDASIVLRTAQVGSIAASNRVCTAEPRGLIYGTQNYNASRPLDYTSQGFPSPGFFVAANAPSSLDLLPAVTAGERADLCVAATLPPNAEPAMIRTPDQPGDRLQDPVPWPDLPSTRVVPELDGLPAPVGDDLTSLQITLPAGQALALGAQTTCDAAAFGVANLAPPACPAASQVGEGLVRLSVWLEGAARHLVVPTAKLFVLGRGPAELARVGLVAELDPRLAPLKLTMRLTLTNGRLQLLADAIPTTLMPTREIGPGGDPLPDATPLQTYVESLGVRFWGARSAHPTMAADLAGITTACGVPQQAELVARTSSGQQSTLQSDGLSASGCGDLDLKPSISTSLSDPRPSRPTGATVRLDLGGGSEGRLPARAAAASVQLPGGVHLGLQAGSAALERCDADDFAAGSPSPATCPQASVVGAARVGIPASASALEGPAYLGDPLAPGELASLRIDAALPGAPRSDPQAPRLKLTARVLLTGDRITVRFDELPALALASIELTLRGGEHALLSTPDVCSQATSSLTVATPSGLIVQAESAPVTVGGDCAAAAPAAQLDVMANDPTPGARGGLSLTLTPRLTSARASALTALLPVGAALDLRGIQTCPEVEIASGSCKARPLGTLRLSAGTGPAPLLLSAPLYRTRGESAGLASALARIPVRIGPLELGAVSVPVAVGIDPQSRRLVLSADLPSSIDGTPLDLASVSIDLAAGVAVNPTSCDALAASAELTFPGGTSAAATDALSLSGCDRQPFAPQLRTALSGESTSGGRPRAVLSLQLRSGDANVRSLRLTLPDGLALDSARSTCEAAAFATGSCGAAGKVGSITLTSGLADGVAGGELRLVRVPGQPQPSLGLTVSGSAGFQVLGGISTQSGRTVVDITGLPDLPMTRLDLSFDGGSTGALRISGSLCGVGAGWVAAATGHGGQSAALRAPLLCSSPVAAAIRPPAVALTIKAKTGLKLKLTGFGGLRLQSAKLTLSQRLRFRAAIARQRGGAVISTIGPKAKAAFSSGSLTLTVERGAAPTQELVARVRWPAIAPSRRGRRTTTLRLRLTFADGSVQLRDVPVTLPRTLPPA